MSDIDHYFKVGKGSALFAEVETFKRLMKEQQDSYRVLEKEFCLPRTDGLEEVLIASGGGIVIGLKIKKAKKKEGDPYRNLSWEERRLDRVGWRWSAKDQFNRPDLRTPEGKVIKARLRTSLGNINFIAASQRIFGVEPIFGRNHMHIAVFAWGKKNIVVKMHTSVLKKIDPKKLKEYKMKEVTASDVVTLLDHKEKDEE